MHSEELVHVIIRAFDSVRQTECSFQRNVNISVECLIVCF